MMGKVPEQYCLPASSPLAVAETSSKKNTIQAEKSFLLQICKYIAIFVFLYALIFFGCKIKAFFPNNNAFHLKNLAISGNIATFAAIFQKVTMICTHIINNKSK
jgi:hypothetical protein